MSSATPSKANFNPRTPSEKAGKSPGGLLRSAVHFLSSTPLLVSAALGFDLNSDTVGGGGSQGVGEQGRSTAVVAGTPHRSLYNGAGNTTMNGDTPIVAGARATSRKVMFRDESLGLRDEVEGEFGVDGEAGRAAAAVKLLVDEREVDRYLGPDDIFDPHTEGIYKNRAARSLSRELKADAEREAEEGGGGIDDVVMNETDDKIASAIAASTALEAAEAVAIASVQGDENRNKSSRSVKGASGKRPRKDSQAPFLFEEIAKTGASSVSSTSTLSSLEVDEDIKGKALSTRSRRGQKKNDATNNVAMEAVSLAAKGTTEESSGRVRTRRGAAVIAGTNSLPVGPVEQLGLTSRRRATTKNSKGGSIIEDESKLDSASVSVASSESSESLNSRDGSKRTREKGISGTQRPRQQPSKSSIEEDVVETHLQMGDLRGPPLQQNPFTEKPAVKNNEKRKRKAGGGLVGGGGEGEGFGIIEDAIGFLPSVVEDIANGAPGQKRAKIASEMAHEAISEDKAKTNESDNVVQSSTKSSETLSSFYEPIIPVTERNEREEDLIMRFESAAPPVRDVGAGVGVHLLKSPAPTKAKQPTIEPEGLWEKSSKHLHEIISIIHTTFHPSAKPRVLVKELVSSRAVPVQDSAFRAVSSAPKTATLLKEVSLPLSETSLMDRIPAQVSAATTGLRFSPHGTNNQTDLAKSALPLPFQSSNANISSSGGVSRGQAGRRVHGLGSSLPYMRRKSAGGGASLLFGASAMGGSTVVNQGFGSFLQSSIGRDSLLQQGNFESIQLIQDSILQQRTRFLNESSVKPVESAESIANRILGALGQLHTPIQSQLTSSSLQTSIIGSGSRGQGKVDNNKSQAVVTDSSVFDSKSASHAARFKTTNVYRTNEIQSKADSIQHKHMNVHEESEKPFQQTPSSFQSSMRSDDKAGQSTKSLSREVLSRSQMTGPTVLASTRSTFASTPVLGSSEVFDFGQPIARPKVQISAEERRLIDQVQEEFF